MLEKNEIINISDILPIVEVEGTTYHITERSGAAILKFNIPASSSDTILSVKDDSTFDEYQGPSEGSCAMHIIWFGSYMPVYSSSDNFDSATFNGSTLHICNIKHSSESRYVYIMIIYDKYLDTTTGIN